jgi:type II secretory pathway pseudopilin PulG
MRSRLTGFSLVEVTLSLAIFSFALVAIIGLFPVALRTARESNAETRATLIARRIVDEIQSLPTTNVSLIRGASVTNASSRIAGLNLSGSFSGVLLYDEQGDGMTNEVAAKDFGNAISAAGAYFAAEVSLTANFPQPGISRLEATIEAPANAPSARRSKFVFVTYMSQR